MFYLNYSLYEYSMSIGDTLTSENINEALKKAYLRGWQFDRIEVSEHPYANDDKMTTVTNSEIATVTESIISAAKSAGYKLEGSHNDMIRYHMSKIICDSSVFSSDKQEYINDYLFDYGCLEWNDSGTAGFYQDTTFDGEDTTSDDEHTISYLIIECIYKFITDNKCK